MSDALTLLDRLGVCSWSLRPASPQELIERVRQTGLGGVQLALDPLRERPDIWGRAGQELAQADITLISGMFGCVGEDYSTLDAIRRTGGVVPDTAWPATWANVQKIIPLAADLGLNLVTFHAGFIPHGSEPDAAAKVCARVAQIADAFAARNIAVGFETGQEDARTLKQFLEALGRPNVGVNFDPANMLLYDKGDPAEAVRLLGPHLLQCHIKDAKRTRVPGTWGAEVPVGQGEVDWPKFFAALKDAKYRGYFVIERETGENRAEDVRTAKEFVLRRFQGL